LSRIKKEVGLYADAGNSPVTLHVLVLSPKHKWQSNIIKAKNVLKSGKVKKKFSNSKKAKKF
jgi:hypothetical protein